MHFFNSEFQTHVHRTKQNGLLYLFVITAQILDINTLFSHKFTMVGDYSCIIFLKELLEDGWVHCFFWGERGKRDWVG